MTNKNKNLHKAKTAKNEYRFFDSFTIEIKLSQNKYTLIDAEDLPLIGIYRWCAWHDKSSDTFYAVSSDRRIKKVLMHRIINKTPKNLVVDHINHDTLDNRKENLRNITHCENIRNGRIRKNSTTGYKGVSYIKASKRYSAYININYKKIHLGNFHTAKDAAQAYNNAAIELHGEFCFLNEIEGEVS